MRPVDRRWRRSLQIREGEGRPRRLDDAWIRRACRVLAAQGRHGGDAGHPRVAAVDRPVVAAYAIWSAADDRTRLELEARLLAGQADVEIAARVGLEEATVAAFEALFFDVRDSLGCIDWIAASVMGQRLFDGSGAGDPELTARLVGYLFGPVVVDIHFGRRVAGAEGLADEIPRVVALITAPVTEATAPRWVWLSDRLAGIEGEAARSSAAPVSGPVPVGDEALAAATEAIGVGSTKGPAADDLARAPNRPPVTGVIAPATAGVVFEELRRLG